MFGFTLFVVLASASELCPSFDVHESGHPLQLTSLSNNFCLDGTPAGFFSDVEKFQNDPSCFVMHLQGGGACTSVEDCIEMKVDLGDKASSANWPRAMEGYSVLSSLSRWNPQFHCCLHVFVPYCTQDLFTGNKSYTLENGSPLHFHGDSIVESTFQFFNNEYSWFPLLEMFVLSGTSAGGLGVLVHHARLNDQLGSVEMVVLLDSCWFIEPDTREVASDTELRGAYEEGLELWGSVLPFDCQVPADCLFLPLATFSVPAFILSGRFDLFIPLAYWQDEIEEVTLQTLEVVTGYGHEMYQSMSLMAVRQEKLGVPVTLFVPSCGQHTYFFASELDLPDESFLMELEDLGGEFSLERSVINFYNLTLINQNNLITLSQSLDNFIQSVLTDPSLSNQSGVVRLFDDCPNFECNPTCTIPLTGQLEVPENSILHLASILMWTIPLVMIIASTILFWTFFCYSRSRSNRFDKIWDETFYDIPHPSFESCISRLYAEAPRSSAPTIVLQNVSYETPDGRSLFNRTPGKKILRNVSLRTVAGKMYGILGSSGSGKSTLSDVLLRRKLVGKVLGTIMVDKKPQQSISKLWYDQNVAYVHQNEHFFDEITVYETLKHQCFFRRTEDLEKQVEILANLVKLFEIDHILDNKVGVCSGGQRKRVSIVQAMMSSPRFLLLDEPTSGLDGTTALLVCRILKSVAEHGNTVLMVIHQPREEIWNLLDKVVVIEKGRALLQGSPSSILDIVSNPKETEKGSSEDNFGLTLGASTSLQDGDEEEEYEDLNTLKTMMNSSSSQNDEIMLATMDKKMLNSASTFMFLNSSSSTTSLSSKKQFNSSSADIVLDRTKQLNTSKRKELINFQKTQDDSFGNQTTPKRGKKGGKLTTVSFFSRVCSLMSRGFCRDGGVGSIIKSGCAFLLYGFVICFFFFGFTVENLVELQILQALILFMVGNPSFMLIIRTNLLYPKDSYMYGFDYDAGNITPLQYFAYFLVREVFMFSFLFICAATPIFWLCNVGETFLTYIIVLLGNICFLLCAMALGFCLHHMTSLSFATLFMHLTIFTGIFFSGILFPISYVPIPLFWFPYLMPQFYATRITNYASLIGYSPSIQGCEQEGYFGAGPFYCYATTGPFLLKVQGLDKVTIYLEFLFLNAVIVVFLVLVFCYLLYGRSHFRLVYGQNQPDSYLEDTGQINSNYKDEFVFINKPDSLPRTKKGKKKNKNKNKKLRVVLEK
eukprot:Lithocolla_globosa_v1_NODE_269_length_4740_cov_54.506510.p1 type:complete len:1221 gc:universal NODE_269_length_4740_cov_54.506510:3732-70(-)